MRLCVSQIAWTPGHDTEALELLSRRAVGEWEAVPARLELMGEVPAPCAFQALLYGVADRLAVFDPATWPEFFGVLERRFVLARTWGVRPLVFGSPVQRRVPDGMASETACRMAAEFFREAGRLAARESCILLIEPNPVSYGCNFLLTHRETAEFAAGVDSPGLGLHWDTGALLAEEKIDWGFVRDFAGSAEHVHLSLPGLAADYPAHENFFLDLFGILGDGSYSRPLSIEMKAGDRGLPAVDEAVSFFGRLLSRG